MSSDLDFRILRVESIIHHTFASKTLLMEALQAISHHGYPVRHNQMLHMVPHNGRLAIVGDRMLDTILCDVWFRSGESKEQWTTIRDKLTSNAALGKRARMMGLQDCIMVHEGQIGVQFSDKFLATAFEALIGAVYSDVGGGPDGFEEVERVMGRLGLLEWWGVVGESTEGKMDVDEVWSVL